MIRDNIGQTVKALEDTAYGCAEFIVIIFISRIKNLWTSGLGFISAGLLVLALIYILRKTTKFIKTMEVFK